MSHWLSILIEWFVRCFSTIQRRLDPYKRSGRLDLCLIWGLSSPQPKPQSYQIPLNKFYISLFHAGIKRNLIQYIRQKIMYRICWQHYKWTVLTMSDRVFGSILCSTFNWCFIVSNEIPVMLEALILFIFSVRMYSSGTRTGWWGLNPSNQWKIFQQDPQTNELFASRCLRKMFKYLL